MQFGLVAMELGAGRKKKEDSIDFEAGIQLSKKTGERVKKGDILFSLYSTKEINLTLVDKLKMAYKISDEKIIKKTIINKL